jgi:hypothetical protein
MQVSFTRFLLGFSLCFMGLDSCVINELNILNHLKSSLLRVMFQLIQF